MDENRKDWYSIVPVKICDWFIFERGLLIWMFTAKFIFRREILVAKLQRVAPEISVVFKLQQVVMDQIGNAHSFKWVDWDFSSAF